MATYTQQAHPITAKDQLKKWLGSMGLSSMTNWTWNLMQQLGDMSSEELMLHMYSHPTFQQRFPAIFELQKQGKPAMSVQEVLAMEQTFAEIMHAAALPPGFYDSYKDFHKLIVADISPAELADRLNEGYKAVARAPKEVQAAFANYFGPKGAGALAAFFLDPKRTTPLLLDMVDKAEVAGAGGMFGFDINKATATELVDFGVDFESGLEGFRQLSQMSALFQETVSEAQKHQGGPSSVTGWYDKIPSVADGAGMYRDERIKPDKWGYVQPGEAAPEEPGYINVPRPGGSYLYNDLRAEEEGVAAIFGTDPEAMRQVQRRMAERQAAFKGGGGALVTNEGVRGLGTAD